MTAHLGRDALDHDFRAGFSGGGPPCCSRAGGSRAGNGPGSPGPATAAADRPVRAAAPPRRRPAPDAQAPDAQAPDAQAPSAPDVQQEPAATHISNPVAVFAGLDKITGRIINFDVYINETVQFGALQVTPRVCYTRPPTEEPRTDAFVEVDEITLNRKIQRIFTGWMFADSPGLHAVDNAVYDVWLTDCKMKSSVPPPSARKDAPSTAKKQ